VKYLDFALRGCGWDNRARYCRITYRNLFEPGWRDFILGFRIFQRYE
jgi:formylglycine-generating enzyme required for sulfatase activity